ncbi:hypothetical protein KCU71_g4669, partial [Aureobasidium melanogenum]
MVKLSDHISWQPIRIPAITDDTFYIFALSIPFIICFSMLTMFLLSYVFLAEKNYAVGRHAFNKGISWSGATLFVFLTVSLATLDVALFVACHHANYLKAIFKEKVLYPVILSAVNRAIKIYNTAYNHVVKSSAAAKSSLSKLSKDEKKMQRTFDFFCSTLIAIFMVLSLYLRLSFSGLLSQNELRYVFRTYFIFISIFSCLMYALYLCYTALIAGYVLDYVNQTAGTHWDRLIRMVDLDDYVCSIPRPSDNDILLHLGEEIPDSEQLLILHMRSQWEFDFHNQNDLVTLFGDLRDHLSLELPSVAIMSSNQFAISKTDGSVKYCRKSFKVMKEQSLIGLFHFAYSSLRD